MQKINTKSLFIVSLIFLTVFSSPSLFSQTLTVSSPQLNFGSVYENAPDSMQLTVSNNLGHPVNVTGVKFYTTYGSPAFSTGSDNFTIADGLSETIWIKFAPRHNIFHNSEMVIENDALRGTVSVDLKGQGKYSNTYYDSTENKSEENLKTTIHAITGIGYDTLGYNTSRPNARDTMFMWLDNQMVNGQGALQNTLECIYTGRLAIGYVDRVDCQNLATYSFNTEHTFPQGFFGSAEPMRSDLHHLFPTDDNANNYRASNPFGMVTSPTWTIGGSKGTTTLFEPRDVQKGQTARAMMYFVLRYQDYNGFFSPQENILRTWHSTFQPTQIEKKRNNDIHLVQHNRNPFTDYPQLIERITSISNFSVAIADTSIDLTQDTIVYGFVQQVVANIFHYTIVNNGTTDVHFTNFSLTNPGVLGFQTGGNDTVIAAGEALGIDISLVTSGSGFINGFLTFNTDASGHSAVSIPIYANDSLISSVHETADVSLTVFPNPVNQLFVLRYSFNEDADLSIVDVPGNEVLFEKISAGQSSKTIDVSMLSAGMYFLKVKTGKDMLIRKIIKQ